MTGEELESGPFETEVLEEDLDADSRQVRSWKGRSTFHFVTCHEKEKEGWCGEKCMIKQGGFVNPPTPPAPDWNNSCGSQPMEGGERTTLNSRGGTIVEGVHEELGFEVMNPLLGPSWKGFEGSTSWG